MKTEKQKRLPKIVITGPPGAGKSSVLRYFQKEKNNTIQCVPEGATMTIEKLGVLPGTPSDHLTQSDNFQRMLYILQEQFENICEDVARNENKTVLLLEKGHPDIIPHLKGGTKTYEKIFKTSSRKDRAKYDCVIFLKLAPESAYKLACREKPSRRESYRQAKILERKVREVWKDHPRFISISSHPNWEIKLASVREAIYNFIKSYPNEV